MRAPLLIRSDLFEIREGEDEHTNPGCYGQHLAEWLAARFREQGYPDAAVVAEDFGWCVVCAQGDALEWVGCGVAPDDAALADLDATRLADVRPDWIVFPVVEIPFYDLRNRVRSWIGRVDTGDIQRRLRADLRAILEAEPAIEVTEYDGEW